jgi:hypothetical protein
VRSASVVPPNLKLSLYNRQFRVLFAFVVVDEAQIPRKLLPMPLYPTNYNWCAFLHHLITNRHIFSPWKIINPLFGANFAQYPAQNVMKFDQTLSEGAASGAK